MEAPPPEIRVGIIGAGGITRARHLPGLKKIPGVRLVAVCNRTRESGEAVARDWGFERVARTPRHLIEADDIHAVMIGTWPYLHHVLSCFALRAGKHVFTQARMARNLAEARQMLREAERHPDLVAMICPSPFAMKSALFVQNLLREGFVGRIRLVRFHSLNASFADPSAPIHWRQQSRLSGVNTLSLGIHLERFLQWFGPITCVRADGVIFTPRRKDAEGRWMEVTVFDQLDAVARLRDHPGHLQMTFSGAVYHAPAERAEIYGERGTLVVDLAKDEVMGARRGDKHLHYLPIPQFLRREWNVEADFIDTIRAGGRDRLPKARTRFFSPDFAEGVRYMAATEAIVRAAKTGRETAVPSR